MTRKDSEKDSERPHYYSQFWLDIAAGRRVIGGPKPEDGEGSETETAEPVVQRRSGRVSEPGTFRNTLPPVNGYEEEVDHPTENEEYGESEEDLTQDQDDLNEDDYQGDFPLDEGEVPDMDLSNEEEENISEEDANEEDTDEENLYDDEDDENWEGGRSRKKGKPTRPTKAPIKKSGKPRRSSY
jgi:hypothetical protein